MRLIASRGTVVMPLENIALKSLTLDCRKASVQKIQE
jgi:hypothetical protein